MPWPGTYRASFLPTKLPTARLLPTDFCQLKTTKNPMFNRVLPALPGIYTINKDKIIIYYCSSIYKSGLPPWQITWHWQNPMFTGFFACQLPGVWQPNYFSCLYDFS